MWWRILGSAIAFESDAAMSDHKAAHGRTHAMAAPLDAGGRVWRAERGEISQAGQTAVKCASHPRPRISHTHTHTPNPTNPRAVTHPQRIPASPLPMVRPPIRGNLGARRGHATRGVAAHLVARRGCSLKAWLLAPRAWLLA